MQSLFRLFLSIFLLLLLSSNNLNAQNWNTLSTNFGYINFGPASTSSAHIYTGSPRFLFNKDVYTTSGSFSSYYTNLKFKTTGTTRLTIKNSNGFIGIGTTNPSRQLHVIGDSKYEGHLKIERFVNSDYQFGLSIWVDRDLTKAFTINTNNGSNLFTIWGNGVVNMKRLYAEEISVQPNAIGISWPDYVFADDYLLLSFFH